MEEFGREPCPMRILEDLGGAFAMGLIGGGIFQGIKGFRNAPTGFNRRFNVSLLNITDLSSTKNVYSHNYIYEQSSGHYVLKSTPIFDK